MLSSISSTSMMASQLFSKLDTKSQGYLEKSDLASAFSSITGNSDTSVDDLFSTLDSNSDGKVTESEFSTTLSNLQQQLDSQFSQMRMQGMGGSGGSQGMAGAGMPPPPPPQDDQGFTKEELQSQLSEIGSSDSQRSSLISSVVNNFSAADTNSDGKVTFQEAMAYKDSSSTNSSSSTSSTSTSSTSTSSTASDSTSNTDAQVMFKIMQLMHAYGGYAQQQNSLSSLLSASA